MNISSLPHHFEEFSTIFTENKLDFDFLGISESRIKLNSTPMKVVVEAHYYIYKKGIKCKCRKDLQIYKPKELESTFIEINQKNKKLMVGCIYRHPLVDLSEPNNHFLTILFEKLTYENNRSLPWRL